MIALDIPVASQFEQFSDFFLLNALFPAYACFRSLYFFMGNIAVEKSHENPKNDAWNHLFGSRLIYKIPDNIARKDRDARRKYANFDTHKMCDAKLQQQYAK